MKEIVEKRGPRNPRWFISEKSDLNHVWPTECWTEEEALLVCKKLNDEEPTEAKKYGRSIRCYVVQRLNRDGSYDVVKEIDSSTVSSLACRK